MADLFRIEVLELTRIASLESLAAQKSLFLYVDAFYRNVRQVDHSAPEGPGSAKGLEGLLGPMVEHVRQGGAGATAVDHSLNGFMTALVKHLAAPERAPSPLPITNVTLRVEEISAEAGMPRELSGSSSFFASMLAVCQEPNPIRAHFGDAVLSPKLRYLWGGPPFVVTGNFGKSKTFTNAAGEKRKRADVSAWVYSKWVPHLSIGKVWATDVSPG